jgi:hypothetical protein
MVGPIILNKEKFIRNSKTIDLALIELPIICRMVLPIIRK